MNTTTLKTMALCAMLAAAAVACKKDNNINVVPDPDNNGDTTVTVVVAVASVSLSETDTTLTVGDTLRLTATVLPDSATNKAVTWESSDDAVATVDDGVVTAVAVGTATITVTTADGGHEATCTVTVTADLGGLGTVSFATTETWTVGSQVWSDAVQATGCDKTTFDGNTPDCRSNPSYKGDLFSWRAVDSFKNELCPDGWRVPTRQEFSDLDKALGGTGNNNQSSTAQAAKYINTWGGAYGGQCGNAGTLTSQGAKGRYWSQSSYSTTNGYNLTFESMGYIYPQDNNSGAKNTGLAVRCVKDVVNVAVESVALSCADTTLAVGAMFTLTPVFDPADATNQNVTWSSSDDAVATVADGVATAVAVGTATITVTTDDGGHEATCTVTVNPIPVQSVTLSQTTAELLMGSTLNLTPTVLPANAANKNVTWTSSDDDVATVNNGVVTPVANGSANITVTTEDGNKTATCAVTVVTPVASVSLNQTTAMLVVSEMVTLTPTVLPASASNKTVTWRSSNTAVATVADGEVTAVAAGAANITVTTVDGNKTTTCAVKVVPEGSMVLGNTAWAATNVDDFQTFAESPDMYTKFYQWNRETAWAAEGSVSGWTTQSISDGAWAINPCPAGWRLPTQPEFQALHNAGTTWADANARGNAVAGRFYGANHATCSLPDNMAGCIFLPALGNRRLNDGVLGSQGTNGYYWSSTQQSSINGYSLRFYSSYSVPNNSNEGKAYGFSLRCVQGN